jgi:TolB-like protein
MRIVAPLRALLRAGFASLPLLLTLAAQAQAPRPATTPPLAAEPPPHAAPRARVAIRELQIEGEETSPALGLQLQDGFVVGFVRAGIQVLDSVDVARKIEGHPELQKCDTPICLKRLGQVLDVRYVLLLKVNVNGNSYRMTARLFTTEGSTPAVLPVDTQSRFCDVCTVAEARDLMIRLADAIKRPIEEALAAQTAVPPPPPPKPSVLPVAGLGVGLLAIVGGGILIYSADSNDKTVPAIGGALVGAGLTVVGFSVHTMAIDPARNKKPPVGVSLAFRF